MPLLRRDGIRFVVVNYSCEICGYPLPVQWHIEGWQDQHNAIVGSPKVVIPVREPFDFEYVPVTVKQEIEEALDCLSVDAFNGFAAVCRRTVQAICTDLGAKSSSRVKKQIHEMVDLTGLESEWEDLAIQVMLAGHDGAHPNLPEVDMERAQVLLSLLRDLVYQLYTRPGTVREAARLRAAATRERRRDVTEPESGA